jgi:DNA-binding transcriptional ArsR family regulator
MRELSDSVITRAAGRGRALGDPTRVRIVGALTPGALSVGEIAHAIGSQQSSVSKHLQVLFNAGLVTRRRAASAVIYALASRHVAECVRLLGLAYLAGRSSGASSACMVSIRTARSNHPRMGRAERRR